MLYTLRNKSYVKSKVWLLRKLVTVIVSLVCGVI